MKFCENLRILAVFSHILRQNGSWILAQKWPSKVRIWSHGRPGTYKLTFLNKKTGDFPGVTQILTLLGPKISLPCPAKGVIKCVVSGVILQNGCTASSDMIFDAHL